MQHTSEAQQAALQSYYMDTGALTHTHRQHIYVHAHMQVPRKPHACMRYRNDPVCLASRADKAGFFKTLKCFNII